jgi:hypothetical protein
MVEETKAPPGFKAVGYPNVLTRQDDTMYVCQKCEPPWDTFNEAEARSHTEAGVHRPQLDASLTRPPR